MASEQPHHHHQEQQQPRAPGTDQAEDGQQSRNAEGSDAQAGFVYDSASGYWHDAVSGYYYDANTGLYCHPQTQQWYSQDAATGEFTPYAADPGITGAGANALGELHAPSSFGLITGILGCPTRICFRQCMPHSASAYQSRVVSHAHEMP